MNKKYIYICIILTAVIWAGFGLYQENSDTSHDQTAARAKTILGVISPLSGPAASIGEEVKNSVDLPAVTNLEIMHEDDGCDAKKALGAYQNLKLKKADLFYVACSGSVMSLAPLAKENGDLIITAYAGSSEIRKTGDEVIRFVPDAISVAEVMKKSLVADKSKKYAILYENQDYPKSMADILRQGMGNQIVFSEGYNGSDISFKSQLLKFKGKGIDGIIFIPVSDKAAKIILKEMQTLRIMDGMQLIGEVNLCDYAFKPSEFDIHGICWIAGIDTPGFRVFASEFKAAYGKDPEYPFYSALTYDSIGILDRLVAENDSVDEIKAAILGGVRGKVADYAFDSSGEVLGTEHLKRVEF